MVGCFGTGGATHVVEECDVNRVAGNDGGTLEESVHGTVMDSGDHGCAFAHQVGCRFMPLGDGDAADGQVGLHALCGAETEAVQRQDSQGTGCWEEMGACECCQAGVALVLGCLGGAGSRFTVV